MPDARQYAPATQRNREPILAILREILPTTATVLEVSSGTGEHAVFLAQQLPGVTWIPSDINPVAIASIEAWRLETEVKNVRSPFGLDACISPWPIEQSMLGERLDAIVNINMIHIAPWEACLGLMAGAERLLPPGGILYLYGPFQRQGQHTAESNAVFDASLRLQNPTWGVRSLEDVIAVARTHHLHLQQCYPMPANNLSVVFVKQGHNG